MFPACFSWDIRLRGVVCGELSAAYPQYIAGLALLSPALGYYVGASEPLPENVQSRLNELNELGPAAFSKKRSARLVSDPVAMPHVLAAVELAMAAVRSSGYAQAARALAAGGMVRDLAGVSVPVLVGVGARDVVTPPANAQAARDAVGGSASYHEIGGAGHALPQEAPDVVANLADRVSWKIIMTERSSSDASPDAKNTYLSPPVQRAARLLRHIAEGDAVLNMSETAHSLGINRTTLLRLLHTLSGEGFIEPHPDGGWRIGIGLIGLIAQCSSSDDLAQISSSILAKLANTLGLSAHLSVLHDLEIVYLVRRVPNHAFVSNVRVGSRLPAHAANMGRIIIAHLPPSQVDRLYAGAALTPITSRTAVTLVQLHAQLDIDREKGLAWSDGNYEADISSVAAAIFDATDMPVAAINVAGHSGDFAGDVRRAQIAKQVRSAAAEISLRLGWRGGQEKSARN